MSTFTSLPDLSTLRRPTPGSEIISVNFDKQCAENVVLVALARCLGAYCSANDVLLGWQPVDVAKGAQNIIAARVQWSNAHATYKNVLENLVLRETEDTPSSIRNALDIQLDDGLEPFLAVLTPNLDYEHPLIVSLGPSVEGDDSNQTLHLKFSTLKFHASSAELLAKQVVVLAAQINENLSASPKTFTHMPHELLSAVPMLTDKSSYTHYPEVRTVADFIPRHDPANIALEFYPDLYEEDEDAFKRSVQYLTYGELEERSNRFAAHLCAQGLELEDRVTVCMPRGVEFHITMIGIFKAGGCYVPIDSELPEERQKFINKDSEARFELTASNIQEHITASESYPADSINKAENDGLSYLLYTSGTTGTPKGCLLTHDGFAQAIHALSWFSNQAGPNKRRWPQAGRYLAIASPAFDVHLAETFVGFSLGMTVVSAPRSQLLEDLPRWLSLLRVTHVGIVPSLIEATMQTVAETAEMTAAEQDSGSKMDMAYIASGGEKMSDTILEKWADHPHVTLANFYGPSEVTIGCSARLMTSTTRKENVGRIFENCSAYVVDEDLNPVLRGGVGELLVGGRLVGRGYHNRPDLTEKAFIEFGYEGRDTKERVYRTGDLVRLMPDDSIEIMGRIDTQIKLRGVRIESEGVSSVVRNAATGFPGLASNTVPDVSTILSRHPQLKADQLVSFIGLDASKSIAHRRSAKPHVLENVPAGLMRAIKDACTKNLASYMRPAHIVPLDFLPLNQNGKTDNKALDALFQAESLEVLGRAGAHKSNGEADGEKTSRPLNEAEKEIAEIVARYTVADTVQLNPHSNLFQLGCDSFKLTRLASELRSSFKIKSISAGSLIQHPTIEGISTLLNNNAAIKQDRSTGSHVFEFSKQWTQEVEETYGAGEIESVLPPFPVQDGVLYRSADDDTLYIQHIVLRIHEDVDIERIKNSWIAAMSRYEILRTVFHFSSSLVQVVLKPDGCHLPWVERTIQPDKVKDFHSSFLNEDATQFAREINENISTSPAFRLSLYRAGGDAQTFLTLSLHHAIYDGISLPFLLQDVEALYLHENPRPSSSLTKALEAIYDIDTDEAASFWKGMFDGFDWSKIPKRVASGKTTSIVAGTFQNVLSQWEHNAAEINVSLHALLTAAFGVCLAEQMYGVSDVVFGVIRTGRSFADDEINEVRAPLLTVLPTRVNTGLDKDLLQTVQRNVGRVLEFEHVPLSYVQKWVQPGRSLFEVLFSVSIDDGEQAKLWDRVESVQPKADYILAIEIVLDKKNGKIRVDCAFTDPLSEPDVLHICSEFEKAAISLIEGSHKAFSKSGVMLMNTAQAEDDSDSEDVLDGPADQELEQKIQTLVSQFLKIKPDRVSSTSSLIAFGLDSIKSVGLSRALRREGLIVSSLDIMRHPTIRHIAVSQASAQKTSTIDDEQRESKKLLAEKRKQITTQLDAKLLRIDDRDEVEVYPTTVLQAGMLSQTVSSGGSLYVHAFPFKLANTIDTGRLKQAWQRTIQYFGILRTSFHFIEELGTWVQAIHSLAELKWVEVENSNGISILDATEDYIKGLRLSSESSFTIPPVYLRLHRKPDDDSTAPVLVLVLHHALYDGISISRLSDVVQKFYRGEGPEPAPQFADILGYFEYQGQNGTNHWVKQLDGFQRPTLPCITESPSESESISATADISFSATQMSEACKLYEVTVQCFGQASLAKVLARLYNRRDIVFGHVVSGRNVPQAEDILGPMISTLPCRTRISSDETNLEFVRSIHNRNMAAQKWQHASLRVIQRKLGLSSLWDVIFLFQPLTDDDLESESQLWSFDDSEDEIAKIQYPLNIELHQHKDGLFIKAACQSKIFDGKALESILRDFSQSFMQMVSEPSAGALPELLIDNQRTPPETNGKHHNIDGYPVESANIDSRLSTFLDILSKSVDVPRGSITSHTPLASIGVDSITAIQISAKARHVGLKLRAADILRCQVPDDLLPALDKEGSKPSKSTQSTFHLASELENAILARINSTRGLIEDILPASAGMEWLIGMWQLSNRSRFQHTFAFKLPTEVNEEKLRLAWATFVHRNPIMRSTFVSTKGSDVHIVIFKELPAERRWSSREMNEDRPEKDVIENISKMLVSDPLSTYSPPCQPVFVRLPKSNYLILHLHHFQYDAWSLRLLMADLERIYKGEEHIPSRTMSLFLEGCNSPLAQEEQMRYWKSYLPSTFKPSLLPRLICNGRDVMHDSPHLRQRATNPSSLKAKLMAGWAQVQARLKSPSLRGSTKVGATKCTRMVYIDREAIRGFTRLRQQAQSMSLSLNAILLASWAQIQAKYSNSNSATFGLWHLGRSGVVDDIESLPAPCMNVLPLHIERTDTSVQKLANQVQMSLRQRSSTVEQSRLVDVNRWTGGSKDRVMMNVFVNIVVNTEEDDDNSSDLFRPLDLPYFIPDLRDTESCSTAERLAICDLMEEAVLIDFVSIGESITASIEYTVDFLDENKCRELIAGWAQLVEETLKG